MGSNCPLAWLHSRKEHSLRRQQALLPILSAILLTGAASLARRPPAPIQPSSSSPATGRLRRRAQQREHRDLSRCRDGAGIHGSFCAWWGSTPPKVGCGAEVLLRNLYLPLVSGGTATGAPVPTLVVTPGVTMAPTAEPTAAATSTATATATATNAETPSSTPSATTTQAETPSPIPTATATQAGTPSPTPTATTTSTATLRKRRRLHPRPYPRQLPLKWRHLHPHLRPRPHPRQQLLKRKRLPLPHFHTHTHCNRHHAGRAMRVYGQSLQLPGLRQAGPGAGCFDWCMQVVGTDVHQLDSDGDGVACESLPLGWQVYGTADADEPSRPHE